jgi:hypothetical protein
VNENGTEKMKDSLNTVAFFIRWAFGLSFLRGSLGLILQHSFIAGIFMLLAAIVSIPLTATVLEYKYNFQMPGFIRFFVVFVLIILSIFSSIPSMPTAVDSAEPTNEMMINKNPATELNISKTIDETPLVEYHVSAPYSSDMDSWMKEYAQKHRTSKKEELHLFTFSDGKQFEYYLPAGSRNEGTLSSASWVEESSNEILKPTKISEQQFQQNMQSILSHYNGSHYESKSDNTSREILYVYQGKLLETMEQADKASILKNYIDLNPDRTEYTIAILTPTVAKGVKFVLTLKFTPQNHILVEEKSMLPDDGKKSRTIWYDATYTTIENAIEKYDFTNNPGKVAYYDS